MIIKMSMKTTSQESETNVFSVLSREVGPKPTNFDITQMIPGNQSVTVVNVNSIKPEPLPGQIASVFCITKGETNIIYLS